MMGYLRGSYYLVRHAYRLWHAGQLRFRLETFGIYYPALPYQRPWWRFDWRFMLLLLRRWVSYARWVIEMEELRRTGGAGWWKRQRKSLKDSNHDD